MTQHGAIYKSKSIEFLDRFYRDDPTGAAGVAGELLSDSSTGAFAVANAWASRTGFDADEVQGFQTVWLDPAGTFGGHDVDRVLRYANRAAVELATSRGSVRPIETFWVTGFGDEFEIHVHDGKDRVTMFMVLPEERTYGSERAATQSFVVREGDPIEMTRTSGR